MSDYKHLLTEPLSLEKYKDKFVSELTEQQKEWFEKLNENEKDFWVQEDYCWYLVDVNMKNEKIREENDPKYKEEMDAYFDRVFQSIDRLPKPSYLG